ncbi:hypothetical protein B0H17DRAFT_1149950 [Mycena rosella]|uniref:Uncharacterized protein n=1 Tax=Mycena rosella TaxID=1033263 RepID=A0AAD7FNB8_MYCRO|nr:hypothetical protein B0H17DRAFT_1149950 [Mycena rosella]
MIPRFLCVVHRVLFWTEPVLYNMVAVGGREQKTDVDIAILRAIDTRADLFPHSVRQMFLFPVHWSPYASRQSKDAWSDRELAKLLRACMGVVNLLLLCSNPATSCLLPMLEMRLKRLVMFVSVSDGAIDFSLPFFQNLSHLLLADFDGRDGALQLDRLQVHNLCRLPKLTHLALFDGSPAHMFRDIFTGCKSLQALLMLCTGGPAAKALAKDVSLHNERVVILSDENPRDDWYLTIRGGHDMWERADGFISRKHKGEINGSLNRYYLAPPETSETATDAPATPRVAAELPPFYPPNWSERYSIALYSFTQR